MKTISKLGLVFVCFAFSFLTLNAQKFGYVDSNGLLAEMAEVKAMMANLETLQKQLEKQFQSKVQDYQAKEQDAIAKKERGELSPKQEEELLAELQKEQEALVKFQQEIQSKIVNKETELKEPILDKVNKAIEEVAAEKGFQFIFDKGVLLYGDESVDVSDLVKQKLSS